MDIICDRKSFEVGGHWPLWRRLKKRKTTQNRWGKLVVGMMNLYKVQKNTMINVCLFVVVYWWSLSARLLIEALREPSP